MPPHVAAAPFFEFVDRLADAAAAHTAEIGPESVWGALWDIFAPWLAPSIPDDDRRALPWEPLEVRAVRKAPVADAAPQTDAAVAVIQKFASMCNVLYQAGGLARSNRLPAPDTVRERAGGPNDLRARVDALPHHAVQPRARAHAGALAGTRLVWRSLTHRERA